MSTKILKERLALKDDEIAKLQAKIRDMEAARDKQQFESDTVVIHKGIEFRRGLKTAGKWMGFCPKCHLPAQEAYLRHGQSKVVICTGQCGWQVFMRQTLVELEGEIVV